MSRSPLSPRMNFWLRRSSRILAIKISASASATSARPPAARAMIPAVEVRSSDTGGRIRQPDTTKSWSGGRTTAGARSAFREDDLVGGLVVVFHLLPRNGSDLDRDLADRTGLRGRGDRDADRLGGSGRD